MLGSKRGIYVRVSPEMQNELVEMKSNIQRVDHELGLPHRECTDHDIVKDLLRRGVKDYKADPTRCH